MISMLLPLSTLPVGQTAVIRRVLEHTITARLLDLGFEPGSSVTCVLKKSGGEISAYLIKGTVIALRREDAGLLLVTVEDSL